MEANKFGLTTNVEEESEVEIDCSKLILTSKSHFNKADATIEELQKGEFYLKLSLQVPYIDDHNTILALANLSFLYNKKKEIENVLAIGLKMLRFLSSKRTRDLEETSVLFIIKIFYRTGLCLLNSKNLFLASRFLYEAKELLEHPKLNTSSQEREQLDLVFKECLNDITGEMTLIKKSLSDNPENIDQIKEIIKKIGSYNEIQNKEEKFYIICAKWIKKLVAFLNRFSGNKRIDMIPALCDRNKVLIQHFDDDTESNKPTGYYPGPVQNILILELPDYWKDPDENEKHTLLFMTENLRENLDFFYLNTEGWNLIKDTFGYDYEIERNVVNLNGSDIIEVNLRKVNLF